MSPIVPHLLKPQWTNDRNIAKIGQWKFNYGHGLY